MATNRGFFRIARDGSRATKLVSTLTAKEGSSRVGTFLSFAPVSKTDMLGSGHPDQKGRGLPAFLGLLRSADDGRTWKPVSRMGFADLHVFRLQHGLLYAWDAVLGGMLVSSDGGRTFAERPTPRGLFVDFVVAPDDASFILAATEDQLFRSKDQGRSWRPLPPEKGERLAWPTAGRLFRTTADGRVQLSEDHGDSFKDVGRVNATVWRLKALDNEHLLGATGTGAIVESKDAGRTWAELFRP
jgi:photosystem II stability/assembly factor-like uncharacterized protein